MNCLPLSSLQVLCDTYIVDNMVRDRFGNVTLPESCWNQVPEWPIGACLHDIQESLARVRWNMDRQRVTPELVASEYRKATATPTEAHLACDPNPPTESITSDYKPEGHWPFYAESWSTFWLVLGIFLACWAVAILAIIGGLYVCGVAK